MHLLTLSALALMAETAMGYLDASPFFLFSTADLQLTSTTTLQTSAGLSKNIYKALSQCPSEYYIFVEQPGVSSSDYSNSKTSPTLARNLSPSHKKSTKIQSQYMVSELVDRPNTASWQRVLEENCHAESLKIDASKGVIPSLNNHKLLTITFPAPSKSSRSADLSTNDAYLASVLDLLPSEDYTVLYVTIPLSSTRSSASSAVKSGKDDTKQYEMDSPLVEVMHQELRRDLTARAKETVVGNATLIDGPLFDRYQFFTPGIWMGLLTGFILLSIFYIGMTALSSLQVTYAAFDKEMGPLAGKKQQ